jgi:cholesterol transport system auxiliary component
LTVPVVSEPGPSRLRTQLLIAEPSALRAVDSENIVVRTSAGSIEFLRGAQWADRLPRMVQARLADAFQATSRLGGVGRPGEGLAIDYQLVSDIRAFEVRVYGQTRASIEMSVRILNDRNGVVRAARVFNVEVPVSGSGNDAYAAALDRAHRQLAAELVPWVLSSL